MAYENMTYEVILQRMMDRVKKDYPNLDYREGSMIFNALASAALEFAIMYTELDNTRNESFVITASREYMLLGCEQMGMDISVFEASPGVHKGAFNVKVPIGSRWNCDLYNYTVTEYLGLENARFTYRMNCETPGSAPNNLQGSLTPITDIPEGLSYAEVIECLIEGENETSDEEVRQAYQDYINSTASDGNVTQYKRWCDNYEGIGNHKIIQQWNGANTVKVSILSSSNRAASEELINEFQEYLDPNSEGMGNGVAPIGAIVTVSTATELPITVSATVTMKSGYSDATPINEALTKFFADIAYEKSMVAYMTVGAVILGVNGVDSVSDLKVNGKTEDVILETEQIPVLSSGTWTVK
jgi:uncharacterized phage protein gp47/JayE